MAWSADALTGVSLDRYLRKRGWRMDTESGDLCWLYPLAFGGWPVDLEREGMTCDEVLELGPSRPAVYLTASDIVVFSHGTWRGCAAHREVRYTFRRNEAGVMAVFAATLDRVERASISADPAPFHWCVRAGPCGDWFRAWQRTGESWQEVGHAARIARREPYDRPGDHGMEEPS